MESVWEIHGLGNGHAGDEAPLGPPFEAKTVPGVPAIVVKPRSVADAYVLRSEFRKGGTMALFPAEVLVSVYRTLGDVKQVLVIVSGINNALVLVATVALLLTMVGLRQRRYGRSARLGRPRGAMSCWRYGWAPHCCWPSVAWPVSASRFWPSGRAGR